MLMLLLSRFLYSCWCRWRLNSSVRTLSLCSRGRAPAFIILSHTKSATCSKFAASIPNMIVPAEDNKWRSSRRLCNDKVPTWGFDHRFPPSSTSSSNFIHRAVSFHSDSSPAPTSSSISEKSGCDSRALLSSISSPSMNWTRCDGLITSNWVNLIFIEEGQQVMGPFIFSYLLFLHLLLHSFGDFLCQMIRFLSVNNSVD